MPIFVIKLLLYIPVASYSGFYASEIYNEFLFKQVSNFSGMTCIEYLKETISYCKSGNREGLYYTLGQFHEQCMADNEYNFDSIEQQIQEECR